MRQVRSELQHGRTRVLLRSAFGAGGVAPEGVNSFVKNFRAQKVCWLAVAFACLRGGARGVFGGAVGREEKAL